MATLLNTWYGPWAGPNSSNHHRVRIQLYRDSDTGSGYRMHWVWSVQVVRDTGSTYINASWTSSKYYASGTVNGYYLSTTGQQFTVAYGSSCTTTGSAQYYSDTYHSTYKSTASASYTVPKPTYAVTYDANGGTGAPGGQTKTYGTSLTLSSTRPTRTDYDFVGWGTAATATTAAYQPGDAYTGNAALKLYAVWRLNYIHPAVQGLVVDRCDSTGELADDGTYVRAYFGYAADRTFDATNVITTVAATVNGVTETRTVDQQSGSATLIVNAGISETSAYTVSVTATDSYKGGTSTATASLPIPQYVIDAAPSGNALGFGKPASREGYVSLGLGLAIDNALPVLLDGTSVAMSQVIATLTKALPVTLFTGTYAQTHSAAVTLSESAANFSRMLIEWETSDGNQGSTMLSNPNGKRFECLAINCASGTNPITYLKWKVFKVDGTSITNYSADGTNAMFQRGEVVFTNNAYPKTTRSEYIGIIRVLGWR